MLAPCSPVNRSRWSGSPVGPRLPRTTPRTIRPTGRPIKEEETEMSVFKDTPAALSRRQLLSVAGTGLVAAAGLSVVAARPASANPAEAVAAKIQEVAGGTPQAGRVKVEAPEIAENGATVPVAVEVDSPMTADNYVKAIHVFADNNPFPEVASFTLSPESGRAAVRFRMRLARTQNVKAVALMSDGSAFIGSQEVKVTIGGCGG